MIAVFLFLLWSMTQATALSYPTYDPSGAVTVPGSYALLDGDQVITTYEDARSSATTLRIHPIDGTGSTRTTLLDQLDSGETIEWFHAADCFVRYQLTEAVAPSAPTGYREIPIAWMTYGFTGCTGTIPTTTATRMRFGPLPNLGGTSLMAPIIHAQWQLIPENWTGAREPYRYVPGTTELTPIRTDDLAVARRLARWREPTLPDGWTFGWARVVHEITPYGYTARWLTPRGGDGLAIRAKQATGWAFPERAAFYPNAGELAVRETRIIAGRPALVMYSGSTSAVSAYFPTAIFIYDPATESSYGLFGLTLSIRGSNIDALIAIAASLFEGETP